MISLVTSMDCRVAQSAPRNDGALVESRAQNKMNDNARHAHHNAAIQLSKKSSGFTLVEILIALAIFAVIGVAAAACLHQMIVFHARITKDTDQWRHFAIARLLVQKDFENAIAVNQNDFNAQAIGQFSGSASSLTLTRWNKSQSRILHQAPTFMTVTYSIGGNALTRSVVGQPPMPILPGATQVAFDYLSTNKQWVSSWSGDNQSNSYGQVALSSIPEAMKMTVTVKGIGNIVWIFARPNVSG